jgi:glycerol-3-phosphate acyltransferase PlsY
MEIFVSIALLLVGYLLGSIPFGLLLTRWKEGTDLRGLGSGNIGATNVLRTGNKALAASTLLADALKGMVAVWLANLMSDSDVVAMLSGMAAILGHIFPIWLKFKGGKGVATTLAVYAALWWPLFIFAALSWLGVFYVTRISSLSAILAMIFVPVVAYFFIGGSAFLVTVVTGGVVIYRHKDNILRLMRGQEHRFSEK